MDWTAEAQATLLGAAATFVTGVLAVGGAIYVGLRQADIQAKQASVAERQTKILDRQTALAELTLRNDLFEKRYAVYSATNDLLVRATRDGGWIDHGDPIENRFLIAKDKAKFLFRPSVTADLQEIWKTVCQGTAVHKTMTAIYDREGHYGEGNSDRMLEILNWLYERLTSLSDIFGRELRLSDHDMHLG